jgi:flagellar motor switch protein FliG
LKFKRLAKATDDAIAEVLDQEPIFLSAVVLSFLGEEKAARVLERMNNATAITKSIATMSRPNVWAVNAIESVLDKRFTKSIELGGLSFTSKLLDSMKLKTCQSIVRELSDEDPELADALSETISEERTADMNLTGDNYELDAIP